MRVGLADAFERLDDLAVGEGNRVFVPVAAVGRLQPPRERVDDRRAHAVQPACDGVAAAAELAARVQHGEDDLQRRQADLRMDARGHAAAVVLHQHRAVVLERDGDVRAVAGQRFVDGVVYNFVD